MFALLGKPGYEDMKADLEALFLRLRLRRFTESEGRKGATGTFASLLLTAVL
ncbi:MAG: hypothetical protein LUG44_07995 [Clostridiales bacterium]|nr:hypothetical protein [Clostridiales bacterium]